MGKKHTEEAVIPILLRKGLVMDFNKKTISIPQSVICGNKINGKLDFMRRKGWRVFEGVIKSSSSKAFKYRKQKRILNDRDPMRNAKIPKNLKKKQSN